VVGGDGASGGDRAEYLPRQAEYLPQQSDDQVRPTALTARGCRSDEVSGTAPRLAALVFDGHEGRQVHEVPDTVSPVITEPRYGWPSIKGVGGQRPSI
jgi:hypothetical protein